MIDVNTKIHDRFSIEFKTSFVARRKVKENDFSAYMWFFVPYSLDINQETYPKSRFYQDIKSYVRVKTPQFLLQDIVGGSGVPFDRLKTAFQNLASTPTRTATKEYEYQVKMFAAITHSAARDACHNLMSNRILADDVAPLTTQYLQAYTEVLQSYRSLRTIVCQPTFTDDTRSYFRYGDEFMSNMYKLYTTRLLDHLLRTEHSESLLAAPVEALRKHLREENKYRTKMGYVNLKENAPESNRHMVFRSGVLKKYVDSDLYLNVPKRKDGKLVEQLYLGIAAGLAMMFATVVSFFFQQKYGNFTLPFFIVLVISYMIKDRIKELSRYYFAHRIGSRFFDNKAEILLKDEKIGTIKEGMDFIGMNKVPDDVKRVRYSKRLMEVENRVTDEKVMLYRMALHIDRERLNALTPYETTGINDIIRLNVNSFLQKMDNPVVDMLNMNDDGTVSTIPCSKIYYLNIVMQLRYEDELTLRRFRVALNRDGIQFIQEVE
ncbi:MAG: hypothetical protein Q4B68_01050 [Bacteroidales bacterium]|nr:hypothetical protein [Bacteroidales bacterium]